jgi:hypothetical protein
MNRERSESGQFVGTISLDDVLDVFDTVDGPPVVTSADVADATGLTRDGARKKLERLVDRGEVDRRSTAGRTLYWRVDDSGVERRRESAESAPESNRDREAVEDAGGDEQREGDDEDVRESDPVADGLEAALVDVDFPASVDREAAVETVRAASAFVDESGPVSKGDVVAAVMPDHALGYDVDGALAKVDASGERYRGAWWRKVVKPGLGALDDVEYQNGVGWHVVDEVDR